MALNTTIPRHEDAILRRSRAVALEYLGVDGVARRAREIAALPVKDWRGKLVYQIRCHGTRGKGPHDVWVAESLLWQLISLTRYRCVFHAGD